jgi:Flp pilus assembly secretin CpaC
MRVRSDRSVNWWCAAAIAAAAGLAVSTPVMGGQEGGVASDAAVAAADSAEAILDRASTLLSTGEPVRAQAMLMALVASDDSLTLTDRVSLRAMRLLRDAERAVRALPQAEADLQRAELASAAGRLTEAERNARAVLASTQATASQKTRAEGVLTLTQSRRAILARETDRVIDSIGAAFDNARYAEAKARIAEIDDAGIELTPAQASLLGGYRDRVQQLEMVRGEPFRIDTLTLGVFGAAEDQPGVVRRRQVDPGDQPAGGPGTDEPGGDPTAAATRNRANQQPATPDNMQVSGAATDTQPAQPAAPDADLIQAAQRLEAQRLIAEANSAFSNSRFADADRVYSRLLGSFRAYLTPEEVARIEDRRAEARVRLGRGLGEAGVDIFEQDLNRRDLARQQARAQYSNETQQARAALNSGDFEQARRLAAGALLTLNNARGVLSAAEYEQLLAENGELLRQIAAAEEAARVQREQARATRLAEEQRNRAIEAREERDQRIIRLLDSIRALQSDQQYEKALQEVEQLLFIDPNNPAGLVLRDIIQDTILVRKYGDLKREYRVGVVKQLVENREAMVPPGSIIDYPDDWANISRRRGDPMQFSETPVNRAVLATMQDTRLPVNFQDAALEDVLTFLSQFGNLEMDVDWQSLQEIGVDPESLVSLKLTNVPLETVFDRVLEKVSDPSVPAGWAVTDGVLTIASDEVLRRNTVLEIYDIRDLLIEVPDYDNAPEFDLNTIFQQGGQTGGGGGGASPFGGGQQDVDRQDREELIQELQDIIQSNVDPDGWEDLGGETGTIQELNGNLIITNTPKNHRAITGLLSKLRSVRNMQINVESRFLLVREEWFERIGFDIDVYFGGNLNEVEIGRTIDPSLTISDYFNPDTGELQQAIPPDASGFGLAQPVFAPGTQGDQWSPIRADQNSFGLINTLGAGTAFGDTVLGANPALGVAGRFLDDIQVDFLVEATQADRRSVELTAPRLTFTNGQRAYVFVATQQSFVSDLQPVVSDSAVGFDPTLSVVAEGVVLEVDGVISADRRYVTMNVDTAVGAVDFDDSVVVEATAGGGSTSIDPDTGDIIRNATVAEGEIQIPIVTITRVQTTVTVPDQGTILLGGQRIIQEYETETGVPVLSKIPVLNRFFSNRIETKEERTLLVLLKPTVLIQSEEEERNFPGLLDSLGR